MIDKIKLREITNKEKEEKLNNIEEGDYYDDDFRFYDRNRTKKITKEETKRVIESLKYTCNNVNIFKYSKYGDHPYFTGYTILKNKYLIIGIENNILIFDILSNQQLRRYELLLERENNLYRFDSNIIKWNNDKNNEFIINLEGNIILFGLTNDNELKIISQSYFKNIISLKRINENNNKFYDDGIEEYYGYGLFRYSNKNNNQACIVSIFY